jgi:RNA polymerase-binding protein DksA
MPAMPAQARTARRMQREIRVNMNDDADADIRGKLLRKKNELNVRLERITANLRRGYDADSRERAQQLEDREVVDALGNEAREELAKISTALERMDRGEYGLCDECGEPVGAGRLKAYPYALECIDCARGEENSRSRN